MARPLAKSVRGIKERVHVDINTSQAYNLALASATISELPRANYAIMLLANTGGRDMHARGAMLPVLLRS
eukprot:5969571-Amphidinium_carterae.1